ncbi:MAG: methyltransferase, TrmH family, group 2 [Rhodocyclales bacterium]|nr:methyltransferase, TrmH family, group 2 [Rhodocyclales bacterium]
MFHIVLFEPEIPPNTGNIMRLCANTGAQLHLVQPLGFELSDKLLARAGMDYRDKAVVTVHGDWLACSTALAGRRMFAMTTHGSQRFDIPRYEAGDVFVFGPESRGLPVWLRESFPAERRLRIPMVADSRSLNLSNSAAVVVFEAWRQLEFSAGV